MLKQSLLILALFAVQITFAQFQTLDKLLPRDYSILDSASGDINRAGIKDLVVILRNKNETSDTDFARPLLLLQGNNKGQYKLLARNDSVVLCMGCGGVFGDPYEGIAIKNGYFSIEHYGGSSWRWTRIITFKYDTKTKKFILHRDAGQSWHVSDPKKITGDLYNRKDFGKLPFNKYSYHKSWL